ncbi:Cytochrome P450-like protein 26 [Elsinoe fawcettii]|nr:Cytochrome P450-like protein 26 [Elsinoe fawcettii]
MALTSLLPLPSPLSDPLNILLLSLLLLTLSLILSRTLLSPLSSIPGPLLLKLSRLSLLYSSYTGREATYLTSLFASSPSPILRIGPKEVLIADGSALGAIYSANGGFAKAECYRNFDIMGWPSLFSALDKGYRAQRARSVVGLFATRRIREGEEGLREVVRAWVGRMEGEKARAREGRENGGEGRMDVLDAGRSLAVDVVSRYLFGVSYGGLSEGDENEGGKGEQKLSASEFVNAFVGVGRFFFLPNWLFVAVEKVSQYLFETKETVESMGRVEGFVKRIVDEAREDDDTYQARMLKAGLTKDEVAAQCMDLMFAGTDSSGMNISTFCWQLAKNQDCYTKVKEEVLKARAENADYDASTLPYLRSCIKETLRLSMANPTRLPRVVPDGGWLYTPSPDYAFTGQASKATQKSYFLPAGTVVSCQIHTLHHNPSVFPDPFTFRPDRWLESAPEHLEKMNRDFIPFSLGSRQCIARNLAMSELNMACAGIIESRVLDGAKNVGSRIEILEWFNSKVEGEQIEIEY